MFKRKQRKRAELRARPFPVDWERILEKRFPLYRRLPASDAEELKGHVHVFLAEKRFEGCAGFTITDEVRVVIAANACLLLLHRDTDYFPSMTSILVYPTTFLVEKAEAEHDWVVSEYTEDLAGESWDLGPVVLSWEDVLEDAAEDADGYNVVLHEFAHQLDLENGDVDGVPKLGSRAEYAEWERVFSEAYNQLIADVDAGRPTVVDEYAAEGPDEFFAVLVEAFFETPSELREDLPKVYQSLKHYFDQDPARWNPR